MLHHHLRKLFCLFCIPRCVGSQLIPRDCNICFLTLHIIRQINERISFMLNKNKSEGSYTTPLAADIQCSYLFHLYIFSQGFSLNYVRHFKRKIRKKIIARKSGPASGMHKTIKEDDNRPILIW